MQYAVGGKRGARTAFASGASNASTAAGAPRAAATTRPASLRLHASSGKPATSRPSVTGAADRAENSVGNARSTERSVPNITEASGALPISSAGIAFLRPVCHATFVPCDRARASATGAAGIRRASAEAPLRSTAQAAGGRLDRRHHTDSLPSRCGAAVHALIGCADDRAQPRVGPPPLGLPTCPPERLRDFV